MNTVKDIIRERLDRVNFADDFDALYKLGDYNDEIIKSNHVYVKETCEVPDILSDHCDDDVDIHFHSYDSYVVVEEGSGLEVNPFDECDEDAIEEIYDLDAARDLIMDNEDWESYGIDEEDLLRPVLRNLATREDDGLTESQFDELWDAMEITLSDVDEWLDMTPDTLLQRAVLDRLYNKCEEILVEDDDYEYVDLPEDGIFRFLDNQENRWWTVYNIFNEINLVDYRKELNEFLGIKKEEEKPNPEPVNDASAFKMAINGMKVSLIDNICGKLIAGAKIPANIPLDKTHFGYNLDEKVEYGFDVIDVTGETCLTVYEGTIESFSVSANFPLTTSVPIEDLILIYEYLA